MQRYNFYPTLLNDFFNYQSEKKMGENFLLCDKQKLLDRINRKAVPPTEAMQKGTAFERCLMEAGKYKHESFEFESELLNAMRPYVSGGVWQQFVEVELEVDNSKVRLYGFVDVIRAFRTIDVKTAKQYSWPSYSDGFQHHVYLLGAQRAGCQVKEHVYLVSDFKDYYLETYDFHPREMEDQLRLISRDFISFLENNRGLITDKKIFGA